MAWEIDAAHSSIEFTVKHMMVTTVRGQFTSFKGDFHLDEANPAASAVDFTIDTASISTNDANRDGHLRSPDFFDAATYPTITFKSTSIQPKGDEKFAVTGDLTMHGVTKSVVLEITQEGKFKDMQGRETYAFSGSTTVNRKDFNLNWNVALETGGVLVSEKVNIFIEAQVKAPVTGNA